jgi:hypothetical protein
MISSAEVWTVDTLHVTGCETREHGTHLIFMYTSATWLKFQVVDAIKATNATAAEDAVARNSRQEMQSPAVAACNYGQLH